MVKINISKEREWIELLEILKNVNAKYWELKK